MTESENTLFQWCGYLSMFRPAKEMLLISKWLYRFKNAQRRDKAYQKLQRIRKDFKRYFEQNLHIEIMESINQALEHYQTAGSSSVQSGADTILSILNRLSDCIEYVEKFLDFMESAFNDLMERIEIRHNVPMYIVVMSSLSRIWFYMRLHMQSLIQVFQLVPKLHPLPHPPSLCTVIKKEHRQFIQRYPMSPSLTDTKGVVDVPNNSQEKTIKDYKRSMVCVSVWNVLWNLEHSKMSNRDTIQSPTVTLVQPYKTVELTEDMVKFRQEDFKRPLVFNNSSVPVITTKNKSLKRLPNVSRIIVYKRQRRIVMKVRSKRVAQRIRQYGYHRTLVHVLYVREAINNIPFEHKVSKICMKLKKGLKKKRQKVRRNAKRRRHMSHDIQYRSCDKTEQFSSQDILSIDDIFSTIET